MLFADTVSKSTKWKGAHGNEVLVLGDLERVQFECTISTFTRKNAGLYCADRLLNRLLVVYTHNKKFNRKSVKCFCRRKTRSWHWTKRRNIHTVRWYHSRSAWILRRFLRRFLNLTENEAAASDVLCVWNSSCLYPFYIIPILLSEILCTFLRQKIYIFFVAATCQDLLCIKWGSLVWGEARKLFGWAEAMRRSWSAWGVQLAHVLSNKLTDNYR